MTKVQVTKNEYDYLETFGGMKNKAIFYISRYGWSFDLKDGRDRLYNGKGKYWSEILGNGNFDNIRDKLIRAALDGYELEEPCYWVRDKGGYAMLYKTPKGYITSTYYKINHEQQLSKKERYTFTEKEIKEYDERYWAFAVLVEEN